MKRVLVACCSDRDLRGDYNIAWSVVLHRGQDGGRAQTLVLDGGELRSFLELSSFVCDDPTVPASLPHCCIMGPEVPPLGSSIFWVSKDPQKMQIPNILENRYQVMCV